MYKCECRLAFGDADDDDDVMATKGKKPKFMPWKYH